MGRAAGGGAGGDAPRPPRQRAGSLRAPPAGGYRRGARAHRRRMAALALWQLGRTQRAPGAGGGLAAHRPAACRRPATRALMGAVARGAAKLRRVADEQVRSPSRQLPAPPPAGARGACYAARPTSRARGRDCGASQPSKCRRQPVVPLQVRRQVDGRQPAVAHDDAAVDHRVPHARSVASPGRTAPPRRVVQAPATRRCRRAAADCERVGALPVPARRCRRQVQHLRALPSDLQHLASHQRTWPLHRVGPRCSSSAVAPSPSILARVVAGRAVDFHGHRHAGVAHGADRRSPRGHAHAGQWATRCRCANRSMPAASSLTQSFMHHVAADPTECLACSGDAAELLARYCRRCRCRSPGPGACVTRPSRAPATRRRASARSRYQPAH